MPLLSGAAKHLYTLSVMNICIITDGKKGHLSQTFGLAEALLERAQQLKPEGKHAIHELDIRNKSWWGKFRYKGEPDSPTEVDLVLCAGHSTHFAALSFARSRKCACMVCMKPSLPISLFSLGLIPEHDLKAKDYHNSSIFPTKGALNNIKPSTDPSKKRNTLFLIGGASKEYKWDSELLLNQITHIARHSSSHMVLTTSRRTDKDFVADVTQACPNIQVEPVEETGPNWVLENLAKAKEVWVTKDSVSMVYEALSSGVPVGILDMEQKTFRKDKTSRVTRGLNKLIEEDRVNSFTQWAQSHQLHQQEIFSEASRAADYIQKHFPHLFA